MKVTINDIGGIQVDQRRMIYPVLVAFVLLILTMGGNDQNSSKSASVQAPSAVVDTSGNSLQK